MHFFLIKKYFNAVINQNTHAFVKVLHIIKSFKYCSALNLAVSVQFPCFLDDLVVSEAFFDMTVCAHVCVGGTTDSFFIIKSCYSICVLSIAEVIRPYFCKAFLTWKKPMQTRREHAYHQSTHHDT